MSWKEIKFYTDVSKIVTALNNKTSSELSSDASIDEIVAVINNCAIFNSGTTYVVYGSGADTSLISGWTIH